jgi:hypothetical protein
MHSSGPWRQGGARLHARRAHTKSMRAGADGFATPGYGPTARLRCEAVAAIKSFMCLTRPSHPPLRAPLTWRRATPAPCAASATRRASASSRATTYDCEVEDDALGVCVSWNELPQWGTAAGLLPS